MGLEGGRLPGGLKTSNPKHSSPRETPSLNPQTPPESRSSQSRFGGLVEEQLIARQLRLILSCFQVETNYPWPSRADHTKVRFRLRYRYKLKPQRIKPDQTRSNPTARPGSLSANSLNRAKATKAKPTESVFEDVGQTSCLPVQAASCRLNTGQSGARTGRA